MKIVNKPIKVMAIFNPDKKIDSGKIEPVKFRYEDQVVRIQQINKIYEENILGAKRVIFVCQNPNGSLFEIKYEADSKDWYLFKR